MNIAERLVWIPIFLVFLFFMLMVVMVGGMAKEDARRKAIAQTGTNVEQQYSNITELYQEYEILRLQKEIEEMRQELAKANGRK